MAEKKIEEGKIDKEKMDTGKIYKACRDSIVTMEFLPDSVNNESRTGVYDSRYAKFRTDKVKVIDIVDPVSKVRLIDAVSLSDESFVYTVGEVVATNYDEHINKVCTSGIHYFKTFEAALSWFYEFHGSRPDGTYREFTESGRTYRTFTIKNGQVYDSISKNGYCYRDRAEIDCVDYYSNGYLSYNKLIWGGILLIYGGAVVKMFE